MPPLKAHVEDGRVVLDEPADLPNGTRLYVVPINVNASSSSSAEVEFELVDVEGDDLTDEERAELHRALKLGYAQAKAGKLIPGEEVLSKLRSRS